MKTIFDKIEPKYLECTTGACEHVSHNFNGVLIFITIAMICTVSLLNLHRR